MTEFEKYINRYLSLVPSEKWLQEIAVSGEKTAALFRGMTDQEGNFAYAEGKWTLKEVLQHLIDAEKIFAYRALRFAREDKTELPGWDEENYGKMYRLQDRSTESLILEFEAVRTSTFLFFEFLKPEQLTRTGVANGNEISVENLGKLIVGHNLHHLNVIEERYVPKM